MLTCIMSGGQTGVDRAALDVGLELGIQISGFCPKDRRAEDGRIPDKYPLIELLSEDYVERTERNVAYSDGTLIISYLPLTSGTKRTLEYARALPKPFFLVNLDTPLYDSAIDWINTQKIRVLNVAGPRESKQPGIYTIASSYLRTVLYSYSKAS